MTRALADAQVDARASAPNNHCLELRRRPPACRLLIHRYNLITLMHKSTQTCRASCLWFCVSWWRSGFLPSRTTNCPSAKSQILFVLPAKTFSTMIPVPSRVCSRITPTPKTSVGCSCCCWLCKYEETELLGRISSWSRRLWRGDKGAMQDISASAAKSEIASLSRPTNDAPIALASSTVVLAGAAAAEAFVSLPPVPCALWNNLSSTRSVEDDVDLN